MAATHGTLSAVRRIRKVLRTCSACLMTAPARYRAMVDQHLCETCWAHYQATGSLPDPASW